MNEKDFDEIIERLEGAIHDLTSVESKSDLNWCIIKLMYMKSLLNKEDEK